jgi:hypothetical protein
MKKSLKNIPGKVLKSFKNENLLKEPQNHIKIHHSRTLQHSISFLNQLDWVLKKQRKNA